MVKLIGTAAAIADALVPALEPDGCGKIRATEPGGRDVILSTITGVAPSLSGCLEPYLDSLLAETMLMEHCCA